MWKPWEKSTAWDCKLFGEEKYRQMYAIDCHTEGEPTRILIDGIPPVLGATMAEKKQYMEEHLDDVRTIAMLEPRGHRDMFGSILLEPIDEEADFGIVFMDGGGYLNMCGHGTIGAATAVVETGMLEAREPYTDVVFEAPAGLVRAKVRVENGKAKEVSFVNVPAFVYKRDIEVVLPGTGVVKLDIAFGGSFFAIIEASELGVDLLPANMPQIMEKALLLRQIINDTIPIQHPEKTHIRTVDLVEIYGPALSGAADRRNVVVFGTGQFDRSPCGTGTSAKLALLYDKGEIGMDQPFRYESIIGTIFKGRIIGKTKVGDFEAVIPEITGSAHITGCNCLMADAADPVEKGFIV